MKIILYLFSALLISKSISATKIFTTDDYELNFTSNNIKIVKEQKIDEIKIKSFKSIFKKILTKNDYDNLEDNINIIFVNSFILNMTIDEEKIINNNYFSNIKFNFNEDLIVKYFVKNKINYVNYLPEKFLLIIYDENKIKNNLLSKKNIYYKNLLINKNKFLLNSFILPNLDFNDRYLLSKNDFMNNSINKFNKLQKKYQSNYIVKIYSKKINKNYYLKIFLLNDKREYFLEDKVISILNFNSIFLESYNKAFDKWKEINKINTSVINNLDCIIKINNTYELIFVRKVLKSNHVIKKFILKSIMLNQNIYNLTFFGDMESFRKSLNKTRLNLVLKNNKCNINLI